MSVVIRNRFGNELETTKEIALAMVGRGEAEIVESAEPVTKKKGKKAVESVEETESEESAEPVTE